MDGDDDDDDDDGDDGDDDDHGHSGVSLHDSVQVCAKMKGMKNMLFSPGVTVWNDGGDQGMMSDNDD